MIKAISFALTTIILFGSVGCTKPQEEKKFPEYADDREVMIGGWDSPRNTLEDIQMAKDMGLTHMFLDQVFAGRGTEAYKEALRLYEEVGLNVIVQSLNSGRNENQAPDDTDYSLYPAVDYINYWDEPFYSSIDRVSEMVTAHVAKYGTSVGAFGNLFPSTVTSAFENHTYKEYVKKWADLVLKQLPEDNRWISVDIYPLEERNGENFIRSNWLSTIETAALQAKESSAKTHFFIQSTKHYNYRAVDEDDIRFQFYVYMAFGVQGFSYFTYTDSIFTDMDHACVARNESCKPYDTYYMAQAVNNEIRSFDHVYLNYEWQGTLPILGKNNTDGYNLNFDGLSSPLEALDVANRWDATEDALVGVFKDADGNDGLIVTNFTDPSRNISNLVRFDFKNVSKVRVYRGGIAYDYEVENNRFDLELAPGEGIFMILVH